MALYVIRARESGHYYQHSGLSGSGGWKPTLDAEAFTTSDEAEAREVGEVIPWACDVLELRPVYRDEAAK